jgi:hypothetical protein
VDFLLVRIRAFGLDNPLLFGYPVAVKTEAAWPLRSGRHRVHAEAGSRRSPAIEIEVR